MTEYQETRKRLEVIRGRNTEFFNFLRRSDHPLGLIRINVEAGNGTPLIINDITKPEGQNIRQVDYFASLPDKLTDKLRGTHITSKMFLKELGVEPTDEVIDKLDGNYNGQVGKPAFSYESDNFKLTVYHGSSNEHAERISQIAAAGVKDNADNRAQYQLDGKTMMDPVIHHPLPDQKLSIWEQEDVGAGGLTFLGGMGVLIKSMGVSPDGIIRFDAMGATYQSILLAKKFSEDNNLKVEFVIGYTDRGLSEGEPHPTIPDVYTHANYVLKGDHKRFAYGDVGDAGASLPAEYDDIVPFNRLRTNDDHGPRGTAQPNHPAVIDPNKPTIVNFRRGSHWIRSMYECELVSLDLSLYNLVDIYASRMVEAERGEGVLMYWDKNTKQ